MTATTKDKEEKPATEVPEVRIAKSTKITEPSTAPTMIKLSEFINSSSLRKTYKVETLGGFLFWVKDKAPAKLPLENWKKLLDQFANRIV
jgi:hypothetical protein